jgi:calcineurin-like phosphoesterase family protein
VEENNIVLSNWKKICGPQEAIIKGGSYTLKKHTLGRQYTQLHTYYSLKLVFIFVREELELSIKRNTKQVV